METSFLTLHAIRVNQPFGEFFITKIKAKDLLEISFSDPLRFIDEKGQQKGSQRLLKDKRLKEIANYIKTVEAAFPNSIILAANYDEKGFICKDHKISWKLRETSNTDIYKIVIPTAAPLSSIVDGQHRLRSFELVDKEYQDMELLCSIYFDLPNPYQAFLFATINFNQQKVDKSLAYEQFGFNVEDEPAYSWSPDKLAVYLTRKLNLDNKETTPFFNHIILAPQNDKILFNKRSKELNWAVSTATIVDGILRLISSNPKKDKDLMHQSQVEKRQRKMLANDGAPLRQIYLDSNDLLVFTIVKNFFMAADKLLFSTAKEKSYIFKTVGIQALFDVLRTILKKEFKNKDVSEKFFESKLSFSESVDFSDDFFSPSGAGRSRIKNIFLYALNYLDEGKIDSTHLMNFKRLLK
jgi:DNA phosphorothioation-associated DGQHR protein 1